MYSIYEEFVRQRDQETQVAAARRRVIDRRVSARRWHRAAEWTSHRSAQADRAYHEVRLVAPIAP